MLGCRDSTVERMHRTSIFAMQGFLEEGWYICPAAIIVQILWLAADAALIVLLLQKLGLSWFKVQIVKKGKVTSCKNRY